MMPSFRFIAIACVSLLCACSSGVPAGLMPVTGFELERYLGTWYEAARLDHRFERGMSDVSANYTRREDGGVRVLNRGYDTDREAWKEAEGRAYFTGAADVGALKVSFFGPFYGGYTVIALDAAYEYAMVAGPSRDYLWILTRSPSPDPATVAALVTDARALGFPTDALIYVEHTRADAPRAAAGR